MVFTRVRAPQKDWTKNTIRFTYQRDAGEAYILSQKQEGWEVVDQTYDDGGFTGSNMDRPALQRLLADIAAGKIDCVIVYKVDRLSRSLLDFTKIIERSTNTASRSSA